MGFSWQEYWSWVPCPPLGDLPDPGIKPKFSALQADYLPSEPPGKPLDDVVLLLSHSVVSDSLQSHGLHTRLPCPSPNPGVCSNSCPPSRWCHPTIASSVIPFSCLQPFPASGSFPMSQFFASGGQSIGVSASTSVLLMNIQDWFPLQWTGWISLRSRDSQDSSPTSQFKSINSSVLSLLYSSTLISMYDYWKNQSFD